MGRRTGSRKVRSRLKTRAMKTPRGLVTAKIRPRNATTWSQPLRVISEFLRAQQGVEQIHGGQCADDEHDERLSVHEILPVHSLLHAVAKMYVSDGNYKERNSNACPESILH